MSDDADLKAGSAGALLAAARRKQGLHIVTLAAQLKVAPARLEALEAERWQDLPDPTHARALATSVCRVLGIDAGPVLAGMPRGAGAALERVSAGLNEPVRSGAGWSVAGWRWLTLVLLLLGAAAALRWWPAAPEAAVEAGPVDAPAAQQAQVQVQEAAVSSPVQALASAPAAASLPAASAVAPPASQEMPPVAGAPLLEIEAGAGASWVSVIDASGQSLASRLLQAGERLSLQPRAPVRVVLGNAPAISLSWRGEAQPLEAYKVTRVAKLELK